MEVVLLGTGSPIVHTERYGAGNLVKYKGAHFLIDCGSGVTQRMVAAGSSGRLLKAVFITHLHSDHVMDLYQLILSSFHQIRFGPQQIFGPKGTQKLVTDLMETWREEREERIRFEKRGNTDAFTINVHEIEGDGEVLLEDESGVVVTAVLVDHKPIDPAFGFKFASPDGTVVFSGDTAKCPTLVKAAQGADALVHEVFIARELHARPPPPFLDAAQFEKFSPKKSQENIQGYHTLDSEVGAVAADAGVGILVLSHIVPPDPDRVKLLEVVARDFGGPIVVGEDLMVINVTQRFVKHKDGFIGLGKWVK